MTHPPRVFAASAALLLALTAGTVTAHAGPTDPVTVPDPALSGCLTSELGPVPWTETDLASLTGTFTCPGVADLAGAEHLTGVSTFDLRGGSIMDASPLGVHWMRDGTVINLNDQSVTLPDAAWGSTTDVEFTRPDGVVVGPGEFETTGTVDGTTVTWNGVGPNVATTAGGGSRSGSDGASASYNYLIRVHQTLLPGVVTPPAGVVAAPHGTDGFQLTWGAAVETQGNGPVTGYEVRYRKQGDPWAVTEHPGLDAIIEGLGYGLNIEASVRAVTATAASAWTTPVFVTTPAAPPVAEPVAPPTVGTSGTTVSVSWGEPTVTGQTATDWVLQYRLVGDADWTSVHLDGEPNPYLLTLPPGEYEVRVTYLASETGAVEGETSLVTVVEPAGLPDPMG